MARFFSHDRTLTAHEGPATAPTPRAPSGVLCESYAPGHQMHYLHQGQALRSPSAKAANVIVEGDRVVVVLESGDQLDYHHHDPDRVTSLLGLFPASRVVYPAFHALRLGPYWFNCAPDDFVPCRPGLEH
jgi:hypothetical protein